MAITKAQKFWLESDFVLELVKQVPAYIFWKDRNSVYLGCNNAFAHSLGLSSPAEIVGKTDYDLPTTEEESDSFRADDKQVIESKKPKLNIEEYQTFPDGRTVVLLTNKVPLLDKQNNVIGILGIYHDITDRKKLEENLLAAKEAAEASSKAKTEFLENMRHDIRTPLTGISGFAHIIKDETTDPKTKEYIDNLVASCDSLLEFMNEILETIRIATGETPLYKNKFDLKKRIKDVIDLNQAKAHEKNLQFGFYCDPNLPHYLIGDAKRIHRIVLELVTNALNFTKSGYVNVSIQMVKKIDSKVIIKIIVADSGIGIPKDKQAEVFMRFKRLHPAFEGIYKGAGLGLAVIKQFIDDLDGEIYLESEVDKGSTFTCVVSLKEALIDEAEGAVVLEDEELEKSKIILAKAKLANTADTTTVSPAASRILVVEDDKLAGLMAKGILTKLDCQVDIAPNGETAIKLAGENHYDLIFMDVGLPDISGNEVTKRIRLTKWDQTRHIPIIALTAHVESEDKQKCIEAGMNAVLSKPIKKEVAMDILNAFIPLRAAQKQIAEMTRVTPEKEADLFVLSGPPINYDLAMELAGTQDFLNELLETFRTSLPEDSKKLEDAYTEKDWKTIREVAHKLKGSCSYCGATRLKEASARLETYLKSELRELADRLYQQMLDEMALVKKEITKK